MKPVALLIAPLALLAACSPQPQAEPAVTASDAWCRPAAAGAPAVGCYVTLASAADDRLVSVESPAGQRVEIHTMSMDGGVMRMRELPDGLPLPAGETTALKPGAEHLMLMGPTGALDEGGELPLTLTFEKAPPATVTAQIRSAPHGMAH
ncbi:copper chaperone PCu(A)C [Phenylobacterium sp.]|uniref:copper chaperone PCu(A)C n=1 Tax=Phenylobacterium sp. TaxID=1871053 RepID=UPI0027305376|nr:copper chaperone PCu(A)C [Phenylobacterium sp.]MDP1619025.1 copper chaperone PCu(A)C [Phenylobacterium sp.]MDP1986142.1 copper chaperone PCu(A)C [Phenylobacterium sp.]